MNARIDNLIALIDHALDETGLPRRAESAASHVASDLTDHGQRYFAESQGVVIPPGCWRCQSNDALQPRTGLCRPYQLYLADVYDDDPMPAFAPESVRDQISAAAQTVMTDLTSRKQSAL